MTLRTLKTDDYPQVRDIYQLGIETGHATFETEAPDWAAWNKKFLRAPRLVAVENDEILGWAVLSPVSSRCVYAGVNEVSVYVHPDVHGQGMGSALLQALIDYAEQNNIWTLQAGIFPENVASVQLHEKRGFRIVGTREKLGQMQGAWRDVLLMERRSKSIL